MLSSVGSEEKRNVLENNLTKEYGVVEHRPLEEVIDNGNIHGWLQSQIGIAEKRFACAVTEILHDDPTNVEPSKMWHFNWDKRILYLILAMPKEFTEH
ncbi:hypothetical protein [Anaerotignum sp. MB30-C6]|uniref:hypothetical protein n=1 Tax=Anaerotignum sp. MB30-C6 TaxID=3070814 RepID=UPI0027DB604E|nr:hypothetical protein [Anaerotignum sp. MB30-C6]WMI80559.1 hypothetical protein RBQ60_12075 [Anaerotignum sp. MB30-C6]